MNAARQMKMEMTLRRRRERQQRPLSEHDAREIERFRAFLHDQATLPEAEWREKHADYLAGR